MANGGIPLYTINDVINIDNVTKNISIGTDNLKVYKNLNDDSITDVFRVTNGIWVDSVRVTDIKSHSKTYDMMPHIIEGIINIGEDEDEINVKGKTINIASADNDSTIVINGSNLNIGEFASTSTLLGTTTQIGTMSVDLVGGANSETSIYGNKIILNEYNKSGTTTTIYGKSIEICDSNIAASITTINGKTINIAEDDSTVVMKGIDTTIATSNISGTTSIYGSNVNIGEDISTLIIKATNTTIATAGQENTITTINGNTINIAEETSTLVVNGSNTTIGSAGYVTSETKINGSEVTLGESSYTTKLYIHGDDVSIGSVSTNLKLDGATFELNDSNKAGYIKVNETSGQIEIGSEYTNILNIKADTIDTNVSVYKINDTNSKTNFEINDVDNRITIGGPELNETFLHGSNIFIGKGGGNVTIYGNLVQYSEGSNVTIVTNTITQETTAFLVHNTGTKTAFTVIQDNKVSSGGENLVEFYTESNQDRIPFRVDDVGRVGLGISSSSNLQAWLHVNRNDPDIVGSSQADLLLVEDTDNDSTPFIIKKTGEIGIGTSMPEYKLDVCSSDLKGIALRDVVYIKQHETNRIIFGAGSKLCTHLDKTTQFHAGFTFTYDSSLAISDDTFTFRMTCKMHIAGNNGDIAFRKFEAFISPKNAESKLILLTDTIDALHKHYEFSPPTVQMDGANWTLLIPWKLRDHTLDNSFIEAEYPDSSRVYLDVEFFGGIDIGNIIAEPLYTP